MSVVVRGSRGFGFRNINQKQDFDFAYWNNKMGDIIMILFAPLAFSFLCLLGMTPCSRRIED